jgi:hypothetical protein
MALKAILLTGLLPLVLAACDPAQDSERRISELETRIDALEQETQTLRLKGQAMAGFGLFGARPIDSFFASPEFWEQTYDSGQADCSRRCSANLATENTACETSANPQSCREKALQTASNCHTQCAMNNPVPVP